MQVSTVGQTVALRFEELANESAVDMDVYKAIAKERRLMEDRARTAYALVPLGLDGSLWNPEGGAADESGSRVAADFETPTGSRSRSIV